MTQTTIQDILPANSGIPAQLLAALISSSDDAIVAKSLDGVITSWNPGAMRLYGYTSDEAIGQPMTMLCPVELRGEIAHILAKIKHGERISHYETTRQRKDGTAVPVSVSVSCIIDEHGNTIGAASIARDITEQKRGRKVEALLRRNEEIERSNKNLTNFTYLISHDLRSPLRALSYYSSLLTEEYADDLGGNGCGYAERIATVSEQMSTFVENSSREPTCTSRPSTSVPRSMTSPATSSARNQDETSSSLSSVQSRSKQIQLSSARSCSTWSGTPGSSPLTGTLH
jgi:PAS domain S-box-containing protein